MFREAAELFDDSWQQVMLGQGITPERYHALVDTMSERELAEFLSQIKATVDRTVAAMPAHSDYLGSFLDSPQVTRTMTG